MFIGGTNVYRGMDAFATDSNQWIGGYRCNEADPKDYTYPNHHSDEHGFVFLPSNPDVMYNFNDGGLYRTNDCLADSVQWTPLNNGYVTTQFYTTHLEQGMATSDFVFGGMQDNGTWLTNSDNNALAWKEVHADDGAFGALPYGRDFVITSSQLGRIYKKEIAADGSLVNTKRIDPQNGPSALFINPLLLDPWTSNDLYIAGNKTIWWLPNVAAIEVDGEYYEGIDNDFWVNISESIIPTAAGSISCLDKAYSNNSMIYYGSTSGRAWRLDDCFADEPVKTEITGDEFPEGAYMSCITVNDLQVDEVICSFSNYNVPSIFHSTDGGTSWTNVSGNLEENPDGSGAGPGVYWVEIYPSEPAIYFAATSAGLFSTTQLDGANTIWEMEGASTIGNVVVNMVTARPFDGTIAVGTHGNGIYSGSLPPVDAVRIDEAIASQAWIESYPNPFDDALTFNFVVTENATLSVYDVSGRLVNEWKLNPASAKQSIRWMPASLVGPGIYMYTLQTQRKTLTGKVVRR
ncbi:MAG: T9SS type A sorting domain-containing protein [Flavobacteriales bacterium]|nr:T9SS type A sorting domain-containing protein [Flavobacteriales bacterium]